ncbi:MAG: hypothetical protein JOZ38_02555 [Candidatus Eremiobacteraeota bacterium]|nr:hypothetical protein [Candidatus Eremiobacteraeota bacterium]
MAGKPARLPLKAGLAAAVGATAALLGAVAGAQTYPRLHVTSFTLGSDALRPVADRPFHLVVTIFVKERVRSLDTLVLPNLSAMELTGDERRIHSGPAGSNYTENITVVAHRSGAIHVESAYLDAIDARDGKPKRFYSNELDLVVAESTPTGPAFSFAQAVWWGLRASAFAVAAIAIAWFLIWVLKRIIMSSDIPPEIDPIDAAKPFRTPERVESEEQTLERLLSDMKRRRDRASLMCVREILWEMCGANEGATLSDVIEKAQEFRPGLTSSLRLTEKAAFVQDEFFQSALDEAIAALDAYLR